ncbi:Serine-aspartate repeat-containing protein I precursor [Stieleria neptunia]|uniref:Serine-aspartate repeat-containing protein I n=2 Tax=Stieleria neptunia TaxID=2527979 RepID=A0A518HQT2_9BACT|nr:Serine-aspartate repeat-containing protein I precursor [Stieleria neptunia]
MPSKKSLERKRARRVFTRQTQRADKRRKLRLQPLEDRRVLAALGLNLEHPRVFSDGLSEPAAVSYNATTDLFSATGTTINFQLEDGGVRAPFIIPGDFDLTFQVDASGALVGGVPGDDFQLTGGLDVEFPDELPPVVDVNGLLLRGEVIDFGFVDGGVTAIDRYEVRLRVTGGLLSETGTLQTSGNPRPAYFAGKDIAIQISSEESNFTGSFTTNFNGRNKADLGPTDRLLSSLGDFVWYDNNLNGIQDNGEAGVEGVTVTLTGGGPDGLISTVGDNTTETTTTDPTGFYNFDNLNPGEEYKVTFTDLPPGYVFTAQNAGDDTLDSDADPNNGMTQIVTLAPGEHNPTLDAGIFLPPPPLNPAIDIEKFVKVVEDQAGGGEGLTPGFWKTHSEFGPAPLKGWPDTGFDPLHSYNSVFDVSDDSGLTLLDALGRGGGGLNALGRHATAALLNAANPNVDYSYTQAEVISLTQAAYASGNASLIENTKNLFAVQNELGADLSTPAPVPNTNPNDFGVDADTPPGPTAELGDTLVFTYFVTNPGDVELTPVVVSDDNATPGVPGDDFNPDPVEEDDGLGNFFNVGDDDQDGRLDPGETWLYQAQITALAIGQFTNIGSVVGTPVDDSGDPVGPDVTDDDPANYVVGAAPGIDIEKCVEHVVAGSGEMHVIDFDGFVAGTVIDDEYSALGVTVAANNGRSSGPDIAMIFDSASPTGGDHDLGTPNQDFSGPGIGYGGKSGAVGENNQALGNVLIISEDGDSNDPDDEAHGGTITFTFDNAVRIDHIGLLDIDTNENGGTVVTVLTNSGQQSFNIAALGNNSFQQIPIDVDEVTSLVVTFPGSGAITELKFTKPNEMVECLDADTGDGPSFNVGDDVTFNYVVTNTGDVDLENVIVFDDNATPGNTGDDFNPLYQSGDDGDGILQVDEVWLYSATITASMAGQFTNIADVVGTPVVPNLDDVTDDDPANYVVIGTPDIDIEKLTNGVQADTPGEAVEIAPGDTVTWTYIVTNTGDTPIAAADVVVRDDNGTPGDTSDDFPPTFVGPDDGNDGILSPGEDWEYTATSTAQTLTATGATSVFEFNQSGSVSGDSGNVRSFTKDGVSVNASAFSRDSNGNWDDAYLGIFSGGLGVTDGSESGSNGTHRVDNMGRDNYVLFEFSETVVVDKAYLDSVVNDSDLSIWIGTIPGAYGTHQTLSDGLLSGLSNEDDDTTSSYSRWADFNGGQVAGNVLVLAASTSDTSPEDAFKIRKVKFQHVVDGIYGNIASVDIGVAFDSDPSHYTNPAPTPPGIPNIDIEKSTNGVDADTPAGAVEIAPGASVDWTYTVTNTGETTFTFGEVVVTDDNGTPNDTSDDFRPVFVGSNTNDDGLLSPGEVWTYSYGTTAESLTTSGATSTFYFNGSSGLDGTNGNMRTFTTDGVSVNASAFSRDDSGNWNEAFLGIFSGGLGVTDSSEGNGGNGTHRVDNVGRDNFVLFEFSENVVVDQAYLDSVVNDSDLSIWIGTIPGAFGSHQTLSDALLSGLTLNEVNDTTSSGSRWANFNGNEVSGNVLVLAASTVDTTPEDRFKIRKVKFQHLTAGLYANVGTVVADTVTDSDPSHYKNPVAAPSGKIGNYVWNDLDRDGKQDHNEPGIPGVTVKLLDPHHNVVATTTTDSDGLYSFNGLDSGDYLVQFIAPEDFVFSPQYQGSNADNGSNAGADGKTDLIHLDDHECDNSIDAGLYEAAVDKMFEAEDYEWMDRPWKEYSSSYASGGRYIMAPNGSGSHYNTPPSYKKVMYQFSVDHTANYELSGLVKASSSADNSVWVKIDNLPWVQWHMNTGSSFDWQTVTDGWNQDATSFFLDSGHHTMQLKVREDGVKLDKWMVSKLSSNTIVIDATQMQRSGDWMVEHDDDGNEFLVASNGTPHYSSPSVGDELTYDFTVDQAGVFTMHALVSAADGGSNSFWIAIDDGPWVKWHMQVTNGVLTWQTVSESGEAVQFDLDAGNHTLKVAVREAGAGLDTIVITDDANFLDTV